VRHRLALTVLCLLTVAPPVATAQDWRIAYERGDYPKAVGLLEAAVFDATAIFPEASATEALATLYFFGLGTAQDRVLSMRVRARELLLTDKGALEAPVVPAVTLRATDNGTVLWQFEDAHFAGVVPRLDAPSVPRDQFPPVEPGLGRMRCASHYC
jgi:hypothetical protein